VYQWTNERGDSLVKRGWCVAPWKRHRRWRRGAGCSMDIEGYGVNVWDGRGLCDPTCTSPEEIRVGSWQSGHTCAYSSGSIMYAIERRESHDAR
jgi:hypothetical protein